MIEPAPRMLSSSSLEERSPDPGLAGGNVLPSVEGAHPVSLVIIGGQRRVRKTAWLHLSNAHVKSRPVTPSPHPCYTRPLCLKKNKTKGE